MRTKTLALSTLLGAIGTATSLVAQTNVYSVNAVGYINATIPPGFSMLTCPLVCSPDNTLNTILANTDSNPGNAPSAFNAMTVYKLQPNGSFAEDQANSYSPGWVNGGTITVNPGTAIFVDNTWIPVGSSHPTTFTVTFVGSVPNNASGLYTNVLNPGFNLVGSIIPVTGDLQTSPILNLANAIENNNNSPSSLENDSVYFYNNGFQQHQANSYSGGWIGGNDPVITSVSQGFYFQNVNATPVTWVENFTLNP